MYIELKLTIDGIEFFSEPIGELDINYNEDLILSVAQKLHEILNRDHLDDLQTMTAKVVAEHIGE